MTTAPDPRLTEAAQQHRQGNLEAAKRLYLSILATQPDHPVALHNLGVLCLQGRDAAGAVGHLRRLCTVAPANPRHWQALAQAMAAAGRGGELKAVATEAARHGVRLALPQAASEAGKGAQGKTPKSRPKNGAGSARAAGDPRPRLQKIGRLLDQGRYGVALKESEALIAQAPRLAVAHNLKGLALKGLDRIEEAIGSFLMATRVDPRFPHAFTNLGNCLRRRGDHLAALAAYEDALALAPDDPDTLTSMGNALSGLGRAEAAEAAYRKALALRPASGETLNGLGNLMRDLGRNPEAEALFRQAIEAGPHVSRVSLYASHLAQAKTFRDPADPDIAFLESLLAGPDLPATEQARVGYALGKARHDLADAGQGSHAAAFEAYARAAAIKRATLTYDVADDERLMVELAEALPQAVPADAIAVADAVRPIYIVGMPRSGTSLIEQIIASHPAVHGAGELGMIPDRVRLHGAAAGFHTPWAWARGLSATQAAAFANDCLGRLRALVPGAETHVTDKAPNNFLFAGVLARLLPGARIVHIHRDPMDVGLSCFIQHFAEQAQHYSYDLEELGRYMRAYQRLVDRWRQVLPGEVFIDLAYADLVDAPEPTIRDLIGRLGLPWDDACLSHHRSRRMVQTPSSGQVREPIHAGRQGRWRRFEAQLEPLRRVLEGEG
ncbi:tetratricopeptide repeat-containing sulfotransferase family protein [Roseospirillum parvum]|uniref:Tfp pilus assembly protein PilF n=1 Tax=Roseospirillum parvum TaxID=83401 RepID=A0A1G8DTQ6_9PROT|nr:sulfotransferase [Roseospirillum parvum]SDH61052.1 Tfp pilus assembly protein PilF [Roseospirillum parvum]